MSEHRLNVKDVSSDTLNAPMVTIVVNERQLKSERKDSDRAKGRKSSLVNEMKHVDCVLARSMVVVCAPPPQISVPEMSAGMKNAIPSLAHRSVLCPKLSSDPVKQSVQDSQHNHEITMQLSIAVSMLILFLQLGQTAQLRSRQDEKQTDKL